MSQNKQTVKKYMNAFNKTDHKKISSCLADDIEWVMHGVFHITGKETFGIKSMKWPFLSVLYNFGFYPPFIFSPQFSNYQIKRELCKTVLLPDISVIKMWKTSFVAN